MKTESTRWTTVLGAIAFGAACMYLLDPDKGRRRRAVGRDRMRRIVGDARTFANAAARDANHRLRGVGARVRRRLRRESIPDDLMIIERVRAQLGRAVSHPHAIQVGANRGVVVLSGPILAAEVAPLLAQVRSVAGVVSMEHHLAVYDTAASIPSLQGGRGPRERPQRWSPAARGAAVVGGTLLALYGAKARSVSGLLLTLTGALFAARGAMNASVEEFAQRASGRPAPERINRTTSNGGQPAASDG